MQDVFSGISKSQFFGAQELKGKSEDKLQKVLNVLNKSVKIYGVEIAIFKNKAKGFLRENIKRVEL